MPITPFHRADLLVALLRAKCPHHYFTEEEWLRDLRRFAYADSNELLRAAKREGLLVRDYGDKHQDRYRLVDNLLMHHPVAYFHEGFSQRARRPLLPVSALGRQPRAKKTPPGEITFPPVFKEAPPGPHACLQTRVSYFQAPSVGKLPNPPARAAAVTKRGDVTLHQLYEVIRAAPARLAQATQLIGLLHGTPLAPFVAGCLDQVAFGGVWTPGQGLTERAPLVALRLTVDPARLTGEQARELLLTDPQLQEPLLLLYGHDDTGQLVVGLEQPLVGTVEPAEAQYRYYFTEQYAPQGLHCEAPTPDEPEMVLFPVWSDPAAYLNRALLA